MKKTAAIIYLILILAFLRDVGAQPNANTKNRMMLKDGKLIPAPTDEHETMRANNTYFDWEGFDRSIKQDEELAKQNGWPKSGWQFPESLPVDRPLLFEVPQSQKLEFCDYTASYSFPDQCDDGEGNIIFRAGHDPQSVLDEIKAKQGKLGKYNIVPADFINDPNAGTDDSPLSAEDQAAIKAAGNADDGWSGYPRENFEGTPEPNHE